MAILRSPYSLIDKRQRVLMATVLFTWKWIELKNWHYFFVSPTTAYFKTVPEVAKKFFLVILVVLVSNALLKSISESPDLLALAKPWCELIPVCYACPCAACTDSASVLSTGVCNEALQILPPLPLCHLSHPEGDGSSRKTYDVAEAPWTFHWLVQIQASTLETSEMRSGSLALKGNK